MISHIRKSFGDELTTSIKTKLQIFGEGKKECKYFQILKVHFHNERGQGPKRYFQGFFRAPQNLFTYQISRWSDTPFRFLPIYIPFWQICDENIFPSIFEQLFTSQIWNYQIFIKIEQKLGLYF